MSGTSTYRTKSSQLSGQELKDFKKEFYLLARQYNSHPLATSLAMYKPLIYLKSA